MKKYYVIQDLENNHYYTSDLIDESVWNESIKSAFLFHSFEDAEITVNDPRFFSETTPTIITIYA